MATISNLSIDQGTTFSTSVTVNSTAASTKLTAALTSSATTATVASTVEFPENGNLTVGNETIAYTGKTSTTFTGLTRGSSSTTAVAHVDQTIVTFDSAALNLTGYSTLAQLRKSYDSTTSTAFTSSLTSATDGIIALSLTAAQTAAITAGRYQWDLTITSGSSTVTRVVEGIAIINPSVSRS